MARWSKIFTQIDNVNSGQQVELDDVPTTEMFNVPMNNTQYLYDLLNVGYLNSVTIQNNLITIGIKNSAGIVSYTTISISQLNGYTKGEIDSLISGLQNSITSLNNRTAILETQSKFLPMTIVDNDRKFIYYNNGGSYLFLPFDNGQNLWLSIEYYDVVNDEWVSSGTYHLKGFITIRYTSWAVQIYSSVDLQKSVTVSSSAGNSRLQIYVPNNNRWGIVKLDNGDEIVNS